MITKYDAHWVGYGWHTPKLWATKKEMKPLNPGCRAIRLVTRFAVGYAIFDSEGRVYSEQSGFPTWTPTFDFYLVGQGRVIGPQDFEAACHTQFEAAWRGAAKERRAEQLRGIGL